MNKILRKLEEEEEDWQDGGSANETISELTEESKSSNKEEELAGYARLKKLYLDNRYVSRPGHQEAEKEPLNRVSKVPCLCSIDVSCARVHNGRKLMTGNSEFSI